MHLLFCLERIVSDFRHLFNSQNFVLFEAFIYGFMVPPERGNLDASLPT